MAEQKEDPHKKYEAIGAALKHSSRFSSATGDIFHSAYESFKQEKMADANNLDETGLLKSYRFSKKDAKDFRKLLEKKLKEHIFVVQDVLKELEKRFGKEFAEDMYRQNIAHLTGIDLNELQEAVENEEIDHNIISQYSLQAKRTFGAVYDSAMLGKIESEELDDFKEYLAKQFEKKGYKFKPQGVDLRKARKLFTHLHKGEFNEELAEKHKDLLERIEEEEKKKKK